MAEAKDLDFTYSLTDRVIRLSLGEMPDFSGAKFDGDFNLTLQAAQARKHAYIGEKLSIGPGRRIIDLGCGWGPLLNYVRSQGGKGMGLTLSKAQQASCQAHGLDVHLQNVLELTRERFGEFDAAASLGAFEHFATPEDFEGGRQANVYRDFFGRVASVLPPGGRFYLQTMVWGPAMPPADLIDMELLRGLPPKGSDEYYVALLGRQFPGSWLPFGHEQVTSCASPHFRLVELSSGRLDYIETISRWNYYIGQPSFRKTLLKLRLVPHWLTSQDFRLAFTSGESANKICFERELLEHYRMVFERRPTVPMLLAK